MNEREAKEALWKAAQIIDELERRIQGLDQAKSEPIAIVGSGLRLPGGISDFDGLWRILNGQTCTVRAVPRERFDISSVYDPSPAIPGKSFARQACFLDSVRDFDAEFFGISPRESAWMDPQQRLLLECAWEALENAGLAPDRLQGTRVGIYVGIGPSDYGARLSAGLAEPLEGYFATGNGPSFSAGRISFLLGLNGPSVAVDTACSSSLVALHLACRSLRSGDCALAVAGGVQLMLSEQTFVLLSQLRALAADGRCKTFSADADGYGRGEGCGMVALKRLSDAQRDGDPILALIRGTAINHDGASSGLTTPNGLAQRAVIEQALEDARLRPADIDYVEAHGTGTPLGDPIEVEALAYAYAPGRERSLGIGSVKTNIGHLESAAGIAGLLKVVACMQHETIAPSLHCERLNPHLDWDSLPVTVVRRSKPWPRAERSRRAGLSSFGMSGTNGHVIVEEAPAPERAAPVPDRPAELVVLSAKTGAALEAAAGRLRTHLEAHPELCLGEVAYSLMTSRSLFEQRLAMSAASRGALLEALRIAEKGEVPARAARGVARERRGKVAWLFTGQGSQRPGMGRGLAADWPVFGDALNRAVELIDRELPRPLYDILWAEPGTEDARQLDQTGYAQPALFAIGWALAALWRSWGIRPDFVTGHSIGEITAAAVAGLFSLEDGVRLVCARGRLMQALPAGGAMFSIAAPEEEVEGALRPYRDSVSFAAMNGPGSVVISGREADVQTIVAQFHNRGVRTDRLTVSHAFHSPLMQPMLADFKRTAQTLSYRLPELKFVSAINAAVVDRQASDAQYWVQHVLAPVRFADAVRTLDSAGATTFVEIGPRATLLGFVRECLPGRASTLLPSLRSGRPESLAILESVASWVSEGGVLSVPGIFPVARRKVALPTYPWQRKTHWIDTSTSLPGPARSKQNHPLLGTRLSIANGSVVYETRLVPSALPWLGDHCIGEEVVFPATAFIELIHAAALTSGLKLPIRISALALRIPLVLDSGSATRLQVISSADRARVDVYSESDRENSGDAWVLHATARIDQALQTEQGHADVVFGGGELPDEDIGQLYESFQAHGLNYGPAFRGLKALRRGDREAFAHIALSDSADAAQYVLHPALLDAALQAIAGVLPKTGESVLVPFEVEALTVFQSGTSAANVMVRMAQHSSAEAPVVDIELADEGGKAIARLQGVNLRRIDPTRLRSQRQVANDVCHQLTWVETERAQVQPSLSGRWLVVHLCVEDEAAQRLGEDLRRLGAEARVASIKELEQAFPVDHVVCTCRSSPDSDPTEIVLAALHCVQVSLRAARSPNLWWVTRAAVATTEEEIVEPGIASLWGLGRTVIQEQPELRCRLLDISLEDSVGRCIAAEFAIDDGEDQVAWRGGARKLARLARAPRGLEIPSSDNHELRVGKHGTLESLAFSASERRPPAAGEVEIEVYASGLNFRDVLGALGMYPGGVGALGSECAGVVTRLGSGVRAPAVGARVMALAPGAFGRYVTVDARFTAAIPQGSSFAQGATTPVAFLTAWYALHDLAKLRPGETVLIHSAAGGVGMAAIQVAHLIGARILATASPSKWKQVEALGVEAVASSRDLGFSRAFSQPEYRVDVVLNSFAREFVDASLSLLSAGGRFIEMGKTDVRDPSTLAATHPGILYRSFDLSEAGPQRIAEMFASIHDSFERGDLHPLPLRVYPKVSAQLAFRFMAQARHVGKLALVAPEADRRDQRTVLITGGTGALGLEAARVLAHRGVRRLLLVSRSGSESPQAKKSLSDLTRSGVEVTFASADVSDYESLRRVIDAVPSHAPLRGVVHAAGQLHDAVLEQQTPEGILATLAPKALGARHLHQLTRHMPLEFFVMFSSIAGTLGSPGQGGYAAANAYLDGLAEYRRTQGLVATSIAWGPWSGAGMAARLEPAQRARLEQRGIVPLTPAEGRGLFDSALDHPSSTQVMARFDLERLTRAFAGQIPPLWKQLLSSATPPSRVERYRLIDLLRLPAERRIDELTALVRSEVARVLSLGAADGVPLQRSLKELGLDSLMAVEIRNALQQRLDVSLPARFSLEQATIDGMVHALIEAGPEITGVRGAPAQSSHLADARVANWELLHRPERAHARLFCFHDAGGNARMFLPFSALPGVEVHAINHARRVPPSRDAALAYLALATDYIKDRSDQPIVLLGHSLGSSFAWRVAKELTIAGIRPSLFIASALPPRDSGAVDQRSDLRTMLPLLLQRPDLQDQLVSFHAAFEADLGLWEELPAEPCPVLEIPIQAFFGASDRLVSRDDMSRWRAQTTADFESHALPGDHFYIHQAKHLELLLEMLGLILSRLRPSVEAQH